MNTSEEARPQLSVLVIDDEPQIQRLLTVALEANGYRAFTAGDGNRGMAAAAQRSYDAIILDLGLPDINGLEVLENLRGWTQIPVIVLTVQDGETEKVESLDRGADDYVTKPFNTAELLARVRATVRRANRGQSEEPVYRFGDIEINPASRQVLRKGEIVKLTATEYALLRFFVQHAGKVLTHRQIMREVWGPAHETQTSYLRLYVLRLRDKLEENPARPTLIATELGVGYRLIETAPSMQMSQIQPNIDWCDISDLVRVTLDGLKDRIYSHRIRIFLPKNLPLVKADSVLTEQALAHLIVNAVAYTNPGTPIEIVGKIENGFLALAVLDEGPGIPVEQLERIFDPFQRGDDTQTGGLGYRLALVKGLMEVQGGHVEVANRGAGGASFTIYLSADHNPSLSRDTL